MSESRGDKAGPGLDKRRLILDSAIKVFAAKGYHGTRISDIARDAEIAYGLVYHYFKNKEEILDSIFREHWGGFIELVRDVAEDDRDVRAKLLSVAAITLSAYRKRPEWVKVLVFEIQRTQRFADPERLRMAGQLFGLITRILREGQDRGELRKELDPTLASYIFVGGLDRHQPGARPAQDRGRRRDLLCEDRAHRGGSLLEWNGRSRCGFGELRMPRRRPWRR
jgi:TetR/AcrR family fatty acid metabolism transcriptional regulator